MIFAMITLMHDRFEYGDAFVVIFITRRF